MYKINPKWVRHNDIHNDGGYGYNPHPKYIEVPAPAAASPEAPVKAAKIYRDARGTVIDPVAKIAEAQARLATTTDTFARKLIERSIADYSKMMEA